MRRYLFLLVALLVVVPTTPAFAHAELSSSLPVNGAMLPVAPSSIELTWSEQVTVGDEQITLLDAQGRKVDFTSAYKTSADRSSVVITPKVALGDGLWAVSWKAVSGDGHLVTGVVGFQVGTAVTGVTTTPGKATGGPNTAASPSANDVDVHQLTAQPRDRALETVSWLGVIVGITGLLVRRRRGAMTAGVVAALVGAARIAQSASDFGGNPFVIGESKAAAAVAIAGLGVFVAGLRRKSGSITATGGIAFALMAFAAQSFLSGHQLDLSGIQQALAVSAHMFHLLAVVTWCAAVLGLFLEPTVAQARTTRRLATGAVVTLVLAGPVLSLMLVQPNTFSLGRLWLLVLVAKLSLVVVALILGALNHRRLDADRLEGMTDGEVRSKLRRLVGIEVVVLLLVAFSSALLTQSRPPAVIKPMPSFTKVSTADVSPAQTDAKTFAQSLVLDGGLTGDLSVTTPAAGRSSAWMLTVKDQAGKPVELLSSHIEASLPSTGVDGVVIDLEGAGGHVMANASLPLPGLWTLKVFVQLDEFTVLEIDTKMELK